MRFRAEASLLTLLVSSGLAACAAGDRHAAGFVERDSAGIRIAENDAASWTPTAGWRLAAEPHLDIGADETRPGHELDDVVNVARLSDGRLAVANGGSREIRIFDSGGVLLQTLGRNGEGPGEFRVLGRIFALRGDSLLAVDIRLRRLTVFAPDGTLARTARIEDVSGLDAPTPFLLLADGTLLGRPGFTVTPGTAVGVHRDTVTLARYGTDGMFVDTAGRYAGTEHFVHGEGSNRLMGDLPLGRRSVFAAAPDGFYFGSGDRYEIEQRSAAGGLVRLVRANVPNREIPDAAMAKLKEPDPSASADDNAFWQRILAALPLPTYYPAYAGLATDPEGNLWVREYDSDDNAAATWQIFDPRGRWLSALTTPARFQLLLVERDQVIGVWQDDLDVEHVRAWRVTRSES